jgi:hypothetical protein
MNEISDEKNDSIIRNLLEQKNIKYIRMIYGNYCNTNNDYIVYNIYLSKYPYDIGGTHIHVYIGNKTIATRNYTGVKYYKSISDFFEFMENLRDKCNGVKNEK